MRGAVVLLWIIAYRSELGARSPSARRRRRSPDSLRSTVGWFAVLEMGSSIPGSFDFGFNRDSIPV